MASALHAHDLHQSTAEVEFNATTKKLEVSLSVFVSDLELALMRQSERELSLEKTAAAEVDAEIQRFLVAHFVVKDGAGKAAEIEWAGRKMEGGTAGDPAVTLYFEVLLPGGITGVALSHTVFCDRFADQLNLVHLRSGAQSAELRFMKGDAAKGLGVGK